MAIPINPPLFISEILMNNKELVLSWIQPLFNEKSQVSWIFEELKEFEYACLDHNLNEEIKEALDLLSVYAPTDISETSAMLINIKHALRMQYDKLHQDRMMSLLVDSLAIEIKRSILDELSIALQNDYRAIFGFDSAECSLIKEYVKCMYSRLNVKTVNRTY